MYFKTILPSTDEREFIFRGLSGAVGRMYSPRYKKILNIDKEFLVLPEWWKRNQRRLKQWWAPDGQFDVREKNCMSGSGSGRQTRCGCLTVGGQ